ncbi:MAG TPA: hypothetical protein VMD02_06065, partial [Candidatus Omnitrophota bacterium]|nr:hypothetical protein [Candidatus Omnitrophota bacterium]
MRTPAKIIVIVATLLLVLCLFMFTSVLLGTGVNDSPVTVDIQKGMSVNTIAGTLCGAGVIKRAFDLKLSCRMLMLSGRIQAGRYRFA